MIYVYFYAKNDYKEEEEIGVPREEFLYIVPTAQ